MEEETVKEAEEALPAPQTEPPEDGNEALYRAVSQNEEVRARVLRDYLDSLRGVPLLMGAGRGIQAPADRPKTIAEAGALALGYLKTMK